MGVPNVHFATRTRLRSSIVRLVRPGTSGRRNVPLSLISFHWPVRVTDVLPAGTFPSPLVCLATLPCCLAGSTVILLFLYQKLQGAMEQKESFGPFMVSLFICLGILPVALGQMFLSLPPSLLPYPLSE